LAETYFKICPNCMFKNPVNRALCENCSTSISMSRPAAEAQTSSPEECAKTVTGEKSFRRCRSCGTKNYLSYGRALRECTNCGDDEIFKAPVEIEADIALIDSLAIKEKQDEQATYAKKMELRCVSEKLTLMINGEGGIIGREGSIGAEFFYDKKYISRKHAIITLKGERYSIVDVSVNGTKINGDALVKNQEYNLEEGALLTFADVSFKVRY